MDGGSSWVGVAWYWVGVNGQALGVVVTAAAASAAIVYAALTWRLVGWARTQAEAALRQAQATRQILEAAHRPYVEARIGLDDSVFTDPEAFRYRFYVKNHGPVPAILTGWRAIVRLGGEVVAERIQDEADAGISLFPDESRPVEFRRGGDGTIRYPGETSEVEVVVEYRGLNEARYVSRVVYSGRYHSWRNQIEQIT